MLVLFLLHLLSYSFLTHSAQHYPLASEASKEVANFIKKKLNTQLKTVQKICLSVNIIWGPATSITLIRVTTTIPIYL